MQARHLFVLGSLNADPVQRIDRPPAPGETMEGSELQIFTGGKGANQACAAGRLGGRVTMAGKVGDDVFGAKLKAELQASGVDAGSVEACSQATGAARIGISPGANRSVDPRTALEMVEEATAGDLLLCQFEIPFETNRVARRAARERGMVTILDPAPARALPEEVLSTVSILTPNQTEAAAVLGRAGFEIESMEAARVLAAQLLSRGPER